MPSFYMDFFKKDNKKELEWLKGSKAQALGLRQKPRTIQKADHQTGTSNKSRDKKRKAMPPGRRISSTGNVYYEYRKNRSDLSGEKV